MNLSFKASYLGILCFHQPLSLNPLIILLPIPPSLAILSVWLPSHSLIAHLPSPQAVGASPDLNTVKSIMKIAWSASVCSFHLLHASYEDIHAAFDKVGRDFT